MPLTRQKPIEEMKRKRLFVYRRASSDLPVFRPFQASKRQYIDILLTLFVCRRRKSMQRRQFLTGLCVLFGAGLMTSCTPAHHRGYGDDAYHRPPPPPPGGSKPRPDGGSHSGPRPGSGPRPNGESRSGQRPGNGSRPGGSGNKGKRPEPGGNGGHGDPGREK